MDRICRKQTSKAITAFFFLPDGRQFTGGDFWESFLNFRKVFSNLCKVPSSDGNKAGVRRH